MKLSIVVLCWNDRKVIVDCLRSIYAGTHAIEFEVIVSDNGSTDGSPDFIREQFPRVRVIENRVNLRFSKGNNVGIHVAGGEYVLILNPDTVVHEGTLDRWIEFADRNPSIGGFGCRVLNPDGTYQSSARPFPTVGRGWLAALGLGWLGHVWSGFDADEYVTWHGDSEREIDWQSGCCLMVRAKLLNELGGFDPQFEYYYEDTDLCHRIWDAGYRVVFQPKITITHLGGQSTKRRFPIAFELDKYRNRYRYFYKYFGTGGAVRCRQLTRARIWIRQIGYGLVALLRPSEHLQSRLQMYRAAADWNRRIDPIALVVSGTEPQAPADSVLEIPQKKGFKDSAVCSFTDSK